ncbi:MAG TPA: polysaccharide deacetylase family protein [Pyrinomonadaceae bacterium]|jgi:peptidoglycan/xylan/chitin deacetylase (PgdA/CDA1 family)
MRRIFLCRAVLVIALLGLCPAQLQAQDLRDASGRQKEVAVTFDDLPLSGPPVEMMRLRAMTDKLLTGINRHRIPVVGFVNESLLYIPGETDARINILKDWLGRGVELGNHTFSHLGFKTASLIEYEDDFIRGEALTRLLVKQKGQKLRYFRHPFLQMGNTREIEQAFEQFIGERGYRIAPVTIDTMDWVFLSAYAKARDRGDARMMRRVSAEYLKFAGLKFDSSEKVTTDIFGHPIRHILLLHANELNADNFDALIKVMTDRGYHFISLEQALADPAYQYPEKYIPVSNWLSLWAFDKGRKFDSPAPPEFIQKIFEGG